MAAAGRGDTARMGVLEVEAQLLVVQGRGHSAHHPIPRPSAQDSDVEKEIRI